MRFRQVGPSLVVHTPAKLNLFLELLGKREDGYHELETLMVAVDLFDTLTFTEEDSNEIRLRCSGLGAGKQGSVPGVRSGGSPSECGRGGEGIPLGSDNLVVKAAQLLREHAGVERGVRIALVKRIPSAAGLAGGSSDAAATLMALNRFWKLGLGFSSFSGWHRTLEAMWPSLSTGRRLPFVTGAARSSSLWMCRSDCTS